MKTTKPAVDPYLFEKQFEAFRVFVEEQSKADFISFASHPYVDKQEGYKYKIYREARDKLAFQEWKESDIGHGKIIASTIESIEIQNNNLVQWQSRYGDERRPHHILHEANQSPEKIKAVEQCLFRLYHETEAEKSFNELIKVFGKKYPLIAYLLFVKDSSKYIPIAPLYFDRAFELLGANFKTSWRCSWKNYCQYLNLIDSIKQMLSDALSSDVSILDAHSFAWILSAQMESQEKLADVEEYLSRSGTEREAICNARIGQGQFRESLIGYWKACAVTGCQTHALLRASHIKPWSKSESTERLSLYNGLLLSPNLDTCFDSGFVSFDDFGRILISKCLNTKDAMALGLHSEMRLSKIEPEHRRYLNYHRKNIFRKS